MQSTSTSREATRREAGAEARDTAARLGGLLRHVFSYDRGEHLRAIEESGLSLTQCKALLELAGLVREPEPWQVSDLAEALGVSVPSMSRAVDSLVTEGLVTRVEDPNDRRVRRVALTAAGGRLADSLIARRLAGLEAFAASLTTAQRRKLDSAIDALMDREDVARVYAQAKARRRR